MPGNRDYDPDLLNKVTEAMHTGIVPTAPDVHGPTVIHEPDFEHHRSLVRNAAIAIAGLPRIFTPGGRVERAQERVERLQKRIDVAAYIGDKVLNPRGGDNDATKKIGWVGTNKFDSTPVTRRDEDYANLGYQLQDSKNVTDPNPPTINRLRPVTRSEHVADRRIEARYQRMIRHGAEARWLHKSSGVLTNRSAGHRLSIGDQRSKHHIAGDIEGHEARYERARLQLNRVVNSDDWRGRIVRWRLRRAENYLSRRVGPTTTGSPASPSAPSTPPRSTPPTMVYAEGDLFPPKSAHSFETTWSPSKQDLVPIHESEAEEPYASPETMKRFFRDGLKGWIIGPNNKIYNELTPDSIGNARYYVDSQGKVIDLADGTTVVAGKGKLGVDFREIREYEKGKEAKDK